VLLGQAQPDDPSVVLRFRTGAGAASDPAAKKGVAALTSRTLARGTAGKSFEQINELTDGLGASLSVDASQISIELRLKLLREDLPALVSLAAELLREPAFPSTEVDKARVEILAAIKEQENDTRSTADRTVRELIYPDGHPLHDRVLGRPENVRDLESSDLRAFHRQWFGPRNVTVAAVGGFTSLDSLAEVLELAFADWQSEAVSQQLDLSTANPTSVQRIVKQIPGKTQADVAIGFPVLSRLDPNYYALEMANLILGRLGLMGRLGANVRDKQGLAYYAFSSVEPGRANSLWLARAGVDPSNIERAIDGVLDELDRFREAPVSDQEIDDAKRYTTGILPLALESNDGIAGLLLSIEHFGLGLDFVERYPALIESVTRNATRDVMRTQIDMSGLQIGIAMPQS
jgi:zinc protease